MSEYNVYMLMKNSQNGNKVERVLVSGVTSLDTETTLPNLANRYQAVTTDSMYGGDYYQVVVEKRDTLIGAEGSVTVQPGVDYLETDDVVQTKYINTTDGKSKTINIVHPATPTEETEEAIEDWQYLIRKYVEALVAVAPTLSPTTANLKYTKTVTEFSSGGGD